MANAGATVGERAGGGRGDRASGSQAGLQRGGFLVAGRDIDWQQPLQRFNVIGERGEAVGGEHEKGLRPAIAAFLAGRHVIGGEQLFQVGIAGNARAVTLCWRSLRTHVNHAPPENSGCNLTHAH